MYVAFVGLSTERTIDQPVLFVLLSVVLFDFAHSFGKDLERTILVLDQFFVVLPFATFRLGVFPKNVLPSYMATFFALVSLCLLPFDISPFELT